MIGDGLTTPSHQARRFINGIGTTFHKSTTNACVVNLI
jgi:hypothetical protein